MKNIPTADIDKMQSEVNDYVGHLGQQFSIKYMYFEKEEDMMATFFHRVLPKLPFITGWNVIEFDWKYLINRCKRLNIKPMESMVCDKVIGQAQLPLHVGLIDYLEVFMNIKPVKVVENYKLDYIAKLILGVSKLHHEYGSMMEAQQDVENFVKYNAIDVILVKLIEDKLSLLDVAFALSQTAQIEVSKVFSAVFITETLMCRNFLSDGKKMASDKRELAEQVTYEGAYVSKPKPGHYKYVACFDFSSMYPNVQIQFNISPDSYQGKLKAGTQQKEDQIFTKNNTLFTKKKDSAARIILKTMYDRRMSIKANITKLKQQLKKTAA
jgi:DNA polymerase elongation subunit (family B)